MLLYIVRHAWAVDREEWRGPDDDSRPLTDEGQKRFTRVMKALRERGFAPDVVATSPLVRCRQTADIIARELPDVPRVVDLPALSPGSDLDTALAWTVEQSADEVAWVGHSPDVEAIISELVSNASADVRVAKGSIAAIRFDAKPARGQGQLQWFVTAKILGA